MTEAMQATPDCVKPVDVIPPDMDLVMCGAPAAYVAVRYDGWVSSTTWCAGHVEVDTEPAGWMFAWKPLEAS